MVYKQLTDYCFGPGKLERGAVKSLESEALQALKSVKNEEKSGQLPIISLCRESADLREITEFATHIRNNFTRLVILGTGGSSLCGHALAGFMQNRFTKGSTEVIFLQNVDPATFSDFFKNTNLSKTAFLTISKSGSSVETLAQMLACVEEAKTISPTTHFFSITTPGDNPLRRISKNLGIKTYDHDPNVGGRFSILSLVGLIPAIVAGMDAVKLRAGAKKFLDHHAEEAAISASLHVALMRNNIWQNVLMTYPDNLEDLNIWYRQIWAESIGKNGTGSTPIKSMGTIDQHSQMQLYLGGRKDKFYNFITLKMPTDKFKLPSPGYPELEYLTGKTLGDLMNAEQKATIDTLVANKRPVRVIELEKLDEETLGMLIMHLMLETILTAHLLGVNPYDQPAVEEGKIKTREFMGRERNSI